MTVRRRLLLPLTGGGFKFETMLLANRLIENHDLVVVTTARWSVEKDAAKLGAEIYETTEINSFSQRNPLTTAWNFLKAFFRARRILKEAKPDAIVVIGTNVGVPFLIWGKLGGTPTFFIESITRVANLSASTRLVVALKLCDKVFVQWPELADPKRGILYEGTIL